MSAMPSRPLAPAADPAWGDPTARHAASSAPVRPPVPDTPAGEAARARSLRAHTIIVPPRPPLPSALSQPDGDVDASERGTSDGVAASEGLRAALVLRGVTKAFDGHVAVDDVSLYVPVGTFFGLVGPNGAGKTTTLSVAAGLLRPDHGAIIVHDVDAVAHPRRARHLIGVLPDHLHTFTRLTGSELLLYSGVLHGLAPALAKSRAADLARAFGLEPAMGMTVADCSTGMAKTLLLAAAMIHAPRLLVLDEPFEAVDPVSAAAILDVLHTYVDHGGSVLIASHGMELVERVCSRVAIMVDGGVAVQGSIAEVRNGRSLQERFLELTGPTPNAEDVEWLQSFSR